MNQKEMQDKLANVGLQERVWFASRCALRAVPGLGTGGERLPLLGDDPGRHVSGVFLALNASLLAAISPTSTLSYALTSTCGSVSQSAFGYAKTAASAYAAAAGVSAGHAASAAYVDVTVAAAKSAFSAKGAFNAHDYDAFDNAYAADLVSLSTGAWMHWPVLWPGGRPKGWQSKLLTLLAALRRRGLDYWADELNNWLVGIFECEKLERAFLMPRSTVESGPQAIIAYLRADRLVRSAEARVVFLGEGEAGKTSLIRALFDEDVRGDEKATPRVEVRQKIESIKGNKIRVHYWDFGGQVIMHATHQFFLRENSIYIVVLDSRRCDSLEYWLDHVRVFAGGAPTLIALNKVDLLPTGMETEVGFDLKDLCRRYPFVNNTVFPISCVEGSGITSFASALTEKIAENYILNKDMPEEWFRVKEALAETNCDFISMERYDEICLDQKLTREEGVVALDVLDALGVAIHFPQLCRNDVVLNPEWITKAIYYLIWSSERRHLNGYLDVSILRTIFHEGQMSEELGVEVPDDKCNFLLELMAAFRLAFKRHASDGTYCVPMLVRTEEPSHEISREAGIQFKFVLPFLPPGLFYRFLADSGAELLDDLIWRSGAVLTFGNNRALVEYNMYLRAITFSVHGPMAGGYLTMLRQRLLGTLGESYKGLHFEPRLVTSDGIELDWRETILRFARERDAARNYAEDKEYVIKEQLQAFFGGQFSDIKNKLISEIRAMFKDPREIIVQINNNNTIENSGNSSSHSFSESQSKSNIMEIRHLLHADSDLEMALEKINDFRADEPAEAKKYEKELFKLHREIERLRTDIARIRKLNESDDGEKASLIERVRIRWDSVENLASKCNSVLALAPKIADAARRLADFFGSNNLV